MTSLDPVLSSRMNRTRIIDLNFSEDGQYFPEKSYTDKISPNLNDVVIIFDNIFQTKLDKKLCENDVLVFNDRGKDRRKTIFSFESSLISKNLLNGN